MTTNNTLIAIYDFALLPYALGDVLTWNVQTAMRCDEANKKEVDIYICLDKSFPANFYQRDLITKDNCELYFNELYNAFGTHPRLGNIYIYRQQELLQARLDELANTPDEANLEAINAYRTARDVAKKLQTSVYDNLVGGIVRKNAWVKSLIKRLVPTKIENILKGLFSKQKAVNEYFSKYTYSHESINQFAAQKGYLPFLNPVSGCAPDINELIDQRLKGRKIVPFHLRLRQLDLGYGGSHTYDRDSDFLEWYDFIKEASIKYPDVIFIALGRLQEKPLEILRLPNVVSLRVYGLGLGHELTLMLKSDLFIGTSSGYAALANFSSIPYFVTKMNPGSCKAYDIPEGTEKLPFANDDQKLIYEKETSTLLMNLLEQGLNLKESIINRHQELLSSSPLIDVQEWLKVRSKSSNAAASSRRFYIDEQYRHEETAYLLQPYLERLRKNYSEQNKQETRQLLHRLEKNFPDLCERLPDYLLLKEMVTSERTGVFS